MPVVVHNGQSFHQRRSQLGCLAYDLTVFVLFRFCMLLSVPKLRCGPPHRSMRSGFPWPKFNGSRRLLKHIMMFVRKMQIVLTRSWAVSATNTPALSSTYCISKMRICSGLSFCAHCQGISVGVRWYVNGISSFTGWFVTSCAARGRWSLSTFLLHVHSTQ